MVAAIRHLLAARADLRSLRRYRNARARFERAFVTNPRKVTR